MPTADRPAAALRPDPAAVVGALAGLAIIALGARPTGSVAIDAPLTIGALGAVIWFGVRAPARLRLAAIVVLVAGGGVPIGLLVGLPMAGWTVGRMWRGAYDTSPSRLVDAEVGLALATAFVALATAGDRGPFGLTAAVGVAVAAVLVVGGVRGGRRLPTWAPRALAAGVGIVVVAGAGMAAAALSARADLATGSRTARAGAAALRSGEIERAADEFALAADSLADAHRALDRPWTQPARLIPVLAQHRRAGTTLAEASADAATVLAEELDAFDIAAIGPRDGRIDIDAVQALAEPLARATMSLEQLDDALVEVDSGWLVAPVADRLDRLADDTAEQRRLSERATAALDVAPDLLGVDGERRYLMMFTTPGEARGLGGFMGNHALLGIDDGVISVGAIGRTADLNEGGGRPRTVTGPDDWLGRYGPFGFTSGPNGTVSAEPWSNVTMSPHFPSTAAVATELYPQSGGVEIDGVVALDVFTLQEIVGAVGPIEIAGVDRALDGSNLADFLLIEQYRDVSSARLDLLEVIAAATLDRLLGGTDLDPVDLGRRLAPMAAQGRLVAWSTDADEQAMIESVGLAGRLFGDAEPGDDAFSVRVVNSSASKIDTFLERSVCLSPGRGDEPGRATITLTNDAPTTGLPEYVIGNRVGLPTGSSRLLVSWHSTIAADSIAIDGESAALAAQREQDAWVYTVMVTLAAGASTSIDVAFDDPIGDIARVDPQPLVRPERWAIADDSGACDGRGRVVETPSLVIGG